MFEAIHAAFNAISPLTDADWAMIEPHLRRKTYGKGDYYLRLGETEQQIGFVESGSFRWYFINDKGEEVNFHFFFEQGFVVGYDSYVAQTPSRMAIQAMEPSSVVLLPKRQGILDLYNASHHWERFGRIVGELVYAESNRRVQDFLFHTAEERYLKLLNEQPDIFQRISLAHIASYLGIQAPSLSRIRKRLSGRDKEH